MTASIKTIAEKTAFYTDNHAYLADELAWLDMLLAARITAFRLEQRALLDVAGAPNQFITHEEIDRLLEPDELVTGNEPELRRFDRGLRELRARIDRGATLSTQKGAGLGLPQLARIFGLTFFETRVLIICLAPELHRKYDKIYAYLQDDITRKKPSLDLVLDLLCPNREDRWRARASFSGQAALFRHGLLETADDPRSPSGSSGLACFLSIGPRVLQYILGHNILDPELAHLAEVDLSDVAEDELHVPARYKQGLARWTAGQLAEDGAKLVFILRGARGTGKRDLARYLCGGLGCPLLAVDGAALLKENHGGRETRLRLVFREGLLFQAALFLDMTNVAGHTPDEWQALCRNLVRLAREYGSLLFIAEDGYALPEHVFREFICRGITLNTPGFSVRQKAWSQILQDRGPANAENWPELLAARFSLTPGRIREAAALAMRRASEHERPMTFEDLCAACRDQSSQKLRELAVHIRPRRTWRDIVLPEEKLIVLREIAAQAKHRRLVFGQWGFDQKLSHGKGLSVMFHGPSGTGKTLAAEILAGDLQLDLYRIDLASVVSKYIGETEKNLAKIFDEAESANAVLFFDEADALFGKRTQVSDAHDRYANIETSYLLQKMEEYEGMVILATNLRENMDAAFLRRLRFLVDFPFPDAACRSKIWKAHFPSKTPVTGDIDWTTLAEKVPLSGGNIRNIVLNAAFLAADRGRPVEMDHLRHCIKREYQKLGKPLNGDWLQKT